MFTKFQDLIDLSIKTNKNLHEIIIEWEMLENGTDPILLKEESIKIINQMIESYREKLNNPSKSLTGWTGFNTEIYNEYKENSLFNNLISKAILIALATSENNASMGRVVACPTAGSSGVVPGTLVSLYEEKNIPIEKLAEGLLISGAIGEFINRKGSLSGAVGGCQAEIGSATAMASGAIVYILDGDPDKVANAAALSMKFLMGLVCDPVGGFVEVPCVKRNPAGSVIAFTAADLAISGIKSAIPFDEVSQAMGKVGRSLPIDLRETGKGGIAATKTAKSLLDKFMGNKI
ncbi:MAG: L-serine dehydratase [Oceanotoga sp.]|uniref:L-serine ammonia-lyase, iron-sulfur-dependent, subunit alpha n=1 Tax=Oceanotoga sp. TaxID=2108366 RepID=UPI00264D063F|nr:L-serine ammonia-lyase, iron-sulfur-dependent, subunit alpha [Oceanotoga sp.]MDN5341873.1 L-serine dehydratase [Oceanotoga sp.]